MSYYVWCIGMTAMLAYGVALLVLLFQGSVRFRMERGEWREWLIAALVAVTIGLVGGILPRFTSTGTVEVRYRTATMELAPICSSNELDDYGQWTKTSPGAELNDEIYLMEVGDTVLFCVEFTDGETAIEALPKAEVSISMPTTGESQRSATFREASFVGVTKWLFLRDEQAATFFATDYNFNIPAGSLVSLADEPSSIPS